MDCIFCKIASGEIPSDVVYRDERVVAVRDRSPQAPVHVLVLPIQHIEHLQDVTEEHAALLGHLLVKVPEISRGLGLGGDGFRLVSNCKEKAGQSVWHLHFHLMGGRAFAWPPG